MNTPDQYHVKAGIEYSELISKAAKRGEREEEAISDAKREIRDALYQAAEGKKPKRDYATEILSEISLQNNQLIARMCNLIGEASIRHGQLVMSSDQIASSLRCIISDAIEAIAKDEAEKNSSSWDIEDEDAPE